MDVDNDGRCFTLIRLELLSEENSIDVYSFEKENREYFERNLPPRLDQVTILIQKALKKLQGNC